MTGVKCSMSPTRAAAALNDVIAGQINFMLDQYSTVAPNIKAGKLRAIGIPTAASIG